MVNASNERAEYAKADTMSIKYPNDGVYALSSLLILHLISLGDETYDCILETGVIQMIQDDLIS